MGHVLSKDTIKLIPLSMKDNITKRGYQLSALCIALMVGTSYTLSQLFKQCVIHFSAGALRQRQISQTRRELIQQQMALNKTNAAQASSRKEKVVVNLVFFRKLWGLLKIMIPGVFTPEFG